MGAGAYHGNSVDVINIKTEHSAESTNSAINNNNNH